MRRLWALVWIAFAGCTAEPTQIVVHVDAEPGVAAMTESLGIRIWGRSLDGTFIDENFSEDPVSATGDAVYPWTVSLHPVGNDASRFFRLEAKAYSTPGAQGTEVAVARVASSYIQGQTLHVYLLLRDSCIGVPCEDLDSTCAGGECIDIPEPEFFQPDAGLPRDAASDDAGSETADAGPDGSMLDGGGGCMPSTEQCDGMDQDCDDRIDESALCSLDNAVATCTGGACGVNRCEDGWGDCDRMPENGCETDLSTVSDCGACGNECGGGLLCGRVGGSRACVSGCAAGETRCGDTCVDTETDEAHCGRCDGACPARDGARATCEGAVCGYECTGPFRDCDGDGLNGCEVDIRSDLGHCGMCDRECADRACNTVACVDQVCTPTVDDSMSCDDGNACTTEVCSDGTCVITGNTCDAGGMPECMTAADCVRTDACDYEECMAGTCVPVSLSSPPCCTGPADCFDGNACTTDTCVADTCDYVAVADCTACAGPGDPACDDADPCTIDDCVSGRCENTADPMCLMCGSGSCDSTTEQCCSDGAGEYCCGSAATCCDGACCGASESCCGSTCCGPGTTCCGGVECCDVATQVCNPMGFCESAFDGGVDAGSDAGSGGFDAGTDAGGFDSGSCPTDTTPCGPECCDDFTQFCNPMGFCETICGGDQIPCMGICCDGFTETCAAGICIPLCGPGETACMGTCCNDATEVCNFGVCEPIDDGGTMMGLDGGTMMTFDAAL